MLEKWQQDVIEGTPIGSGRGPPHLSELAEALSNAFGGPTALAEMLRKLVNDPKTPDWLKTRAYGIVVNTISNASKLAAAEAYDDYSNLSDEDLDRELKQSLREMLGADEDLVTVVAAWSKLPQATRADILATVRASISSGDAH